MYRPMYHPANTRMLLYDAHGQPYFMHFPTDNMQHYQSIPGPPPPHEAYHQQALPMMMSGFDAYGQASFAGHPHNQNFVLAHTAPAPVIRMLAVDGHGPPPYTTTMDQVAHSALATATNGMHNFPGRENSVINFNGPVSVVVNVSPNYQASTGLPPPAPVAPVESSSQEQPSQQQPGDAESAANQQLDLLLRNLPPVVLVEGENIIPAHTNKNGVTFPPMKRFVVEAISKQGYCVLKPKAGIFYHHLKVTRDDVLKRLKDEMTVIAKLDRITFEPIEDERSCRPQRRMISMRRVEGGLEYFKIAISSTMDELGCPTKTVDERGKVVHVCDKKVLRSDAGLSEEQVLHVDDKSGEGVIFTVMVAVDDFELLVCPTIDESGMYVPWSEGRARKPEKLKIAAGSIIIWHGGLCHAGGKSPGRVRYRLFFKIATEKRNSKDMISRCPMDLP